MCHVERVLDKCVGSQIEERCLHLMICALTGLIRDQSARCIIVNTHHKNHNMATETEASSSWSDAEIESLLTTALIAVVVATVLYWAVLRPTLLETKDEGGSGEDVDAERARVPTANGGGGGGARRGVAEAGAGAGAARRRPTPEGPRTPAANRGRGYAAGGGDVTQIGAVLAQSSRRPPHLSESLTGGVGASEFLTEGVVPFRHTRASGYEARKKAALVEALREENTVEKDDDDDAARKEAPRPEKKKEEEDLILSNRRARARLFTRLFSPSLSSSGQSVPPPGARKQRCSDDPIG